MQLIACHSSAMFAGLKWSAAGVSAAVAGWLAVGAFAPGATASGFAASNGAALVGALAAAVAVVLALRAPGPDGRLLLRREGWCEWFAPGADQSVEMVASGAFEGAGWLVLRLRERAGGGAGKGGRILVLAPDSASAEDLRQLRVWLRLAAPRAALNSGAA